MGDWTTPHFSPSPTEARLRSDFFVWHLTPARRPAKIEHAHEDDTPKAALRPWRASIIRKKLDRIGRVWVADPATAEKVAIEEFHLDEHERKRLSVEEVR